MSLPNKNILYSIPLLFVIGLALLIRVNNLFSFNAWWADDGGAHIAYVETVLNEGRLPSMQETYIAWHEPTYYLAIVGWARLGEFFSISGLDWWEASQLVVYAAFFLVVWLLTFEFTRNKWIALLNVFIFSVLFGSVKLSGYITNELLNHTLILYLLYFFLRWKLLENNRYSRIVLWAFFLGMATMVKVTASIVLIGVIILYLLQYVAVKRPYFALYALIILVVVIFLNIPWFLYKQRTFGEAFTINVFEKENKQNIFKSKGWKYLYTVNPSFLTQHSHAFSYPLSFSSVIIADTFGDYYNLFNNVDRINLLPDNERIVTDNGRFTTPELEDSLFKTNRFGVFMVIVWIFGFIGYWISAVKRKNLNWYEVFALVLFLGGWGALMYNTLRLPYIERGVLKVQFIYFVLPILTTFSYWFYWKVMKPKWIWIVFTFTPFILYTIIAWPQIFVK